VTLRRLYPLVSLLLGALALGALALTTPGAALRSVEALALGTLIALLWALGAWGAGGVVSLAPAAAWLAYLALGGVDEALWAAVLGALVGSLAWLLPGGAPWSVGRRLLGLLASLGGIALALLAAHAVYRALDGRLPLARLTSGDALPLVASAVALLAAWRVMYALTAWLAPRRATPDAPLAPAWIAAALALPLAPLGSAAYHSLAHGTLALLGAALIAFAAALRWQRRLIEQDRQRAREWAATGAISRLLAPDLTLDALLDAVAQQASDLLGARGVTVALLEADGRTLRFPLHAVEGARELLAPRELADGVLDHVIRQNRPLLLPDRAPRRARALGLTPPPDPARAWIGAPLEVRGRVLGALAVFSADPDRAFTVEDARLLASIAGQAALVLEGARLVGAAPHAVQIATLNNVVGVLSGTLDIQQVLDLVISSALAVGGANAAALYLWPDEDIRRAPELVRQAGLGAPFAAEPPAPVMLDYDLEDLARRRQPLIVADVHADQRARAVRAAAYRAGKRGWAEFLLRRGEKFLGILVFAYDDPRPFAPEEIELLRTFASQAALAISNARLYTQTDEALQRRVEQLSALSDISRELAATLNLPRLFQLVLDRAAEATGSQAAALLLAEGQRAAPVVVAARGFDAEGLDRTPLLSLVGAAYRTGRPIVVPDVRGDPQAAPLSPRTRAQLVVPIARGDEVLGVIALGSERPASYTADDRSFVAQLATQAGIAIDNARLFRRTEIGRDRLQVILDSMLEGVILLGTGGQIALANPRVERLLGLPPARIAGRTVAALLDDPALDVAQRLGFTPDALRALIGALQAGEWEAARQHAPRQTFEVAAPGKTRVLERSAAAARDDSGRGLGMLLVFMDVTEQRALAQAREDLSSMIVHDLRGPLTAINTSLKLLDELAQDSPDPNPLITRTTAASGRAVRKLLNLVDSLLDISKMESGAMTLDREPTPLAPLVTTVLDELRPLADELEVALDAEIPRDLPPLAVDAAKTERILLNLVDNAVKYTPGEGRVWVEAEPDPADAGFARIRVCDTGPGIPDEFKQKLFERFVQVAGQRGRRRGTGLGLAFCRMAVEAHGGRIWVEDNPGGGAVVAFTLPVADLTDLLD